MDGHRPVQGFPGDFISGGRARDEDRYRAVANGKVKMMTDGTTDRDADYPTRPMARKAKLTDASNENGHVHILHSICGQELDATPPKKHGNFDRANQRLRVKFALLGFRGQLEADKGTEAFAACVKADEALSSISLDFTGSLKMNDQVLARI